MTPPTAVLTRSHMTCADRSRQFAHITALAVGDLGKGDERELLAAVEEKIRAPAAYLVDLLDLSRIEAGGVRRRCSWWDLADVIAIAAEQVRRRHGEHPISLELPSDLPLMGRRSVAKLERVFAKPDREHRVGC